MEKRGLFIASTGQNVGKTTTCLGLFSGLRKKFKQVCYIKPVGQEGVEIDTGVHVDKDVLLFKRHFSLATAPTEMGPVLIPPGLTRDFLDKKMNEQTFITRIDKAVNTLEKGNPFILAEGTGHCGVGSLINLNNAQVAAHLGFPIILIASGGLGSAYDELILNKTLCDQYNVPILGVILNRVLPQKKAMIDHYMSLALKKWNLPLLGSIPFDPILSNPSMKDFEQLFETLLATGEEHLMRHFKHTHLVATSVEIFRERDLQHSLIITPANREDIIGATLGKYWEAKIANPHKDMGIGLILTGDFPPRHSIVEELKNARIPMLYTPFHSHTVMHRIASFTAKIQSEDLEKVNEAISLVEEHVDFDTLTKRLPTY